jgi:hypothetical protein
MLFLIKYGTKKVYLGSHDPFPFQCPNCKQLSTVDFSIYGEYYHFWYIPVFPYEKDGHAACENCDFKINSLKFNRITKDDFKYVSKKFRFPFYTYIGATIFLLPMALAVIVLIFD